MPVTAIIFDLDDTLVATADLWKQAESRLLAAMGQTWDARLAATHKGMNALDVAAVIHRHHRPAMGIDEAKRIMRSALIEGFEASPPAPMRGAVACVRRAAQRYPLAVASGSPEVAIRLALQQLGIESLFRRIISSETVKAGKPSPDVYLATAAAMGVAAQDCIAVEDSLIGAQAARAAGMFCHLIPSNPQAREADIPGVRIAESLEELFLE